MQFSLPWPPAADKCQSQMELRSRADLWGEYFRSLLLNIAVTQTALRNLVSYLKQKEAAGVISLQNRWELIQYFFQCISALTISTQGDWTERGAVCFPPMCIQYGSAQEVFVLTLAWQQWHIPAQGCWKSLGRGKQRRPPCCCCCEGRVGFQQI